MRRVQKFAIMLGLCAAAVGCEAPGFEEPGPNTDCIEPDVDELPFDRDSIEPLVSGRHRTSLEWRGPGVSSLADDARSESAVLNIRKTGDLRWGLHCGGYVRFDASVDVELSGGRKATFRGEVLGRKDGAQVMTRAKASVSEALEVPGPSAVGRGAPEYGLTAWIDRDGMRGTLFSQTDTAGECERARWPADRACEAIEEREEPFDKKFGGFDFSQALEALQALKSQPLRWKDSDSSTTLAVTVERGEAPICVGIEYADGAFQPYRGRRLTAHMDARVKTGDGRVDAAVPIAVSVQWSEKRGVIEIPGRAFGGSSNFKLMLTADATQFGTGLFKPLGAEADDADSFQSLGLLAMVGADSVEGELFLGAIHVDGSEPQIAESAARETMSLEGVCTEGASRHEDLAHGSFGGNE